MFKITALNEKASSDSQKEFTQCVNKQFQEQIALDEYNRAILFISKGKNEVAYSILFDLLNTKIFDLVPSDVVCDNEHKFIHTLKYSCFKNLAAIQSKEDNNFSAIQNCTKALSLDNSNVDMWYKIGSLLIKVSNIGDGCLALRTGLELNFMYWPCVDKIISVLYEICDYIKCLKLILFALDSDSSYSKGIILKNKMIQIMPSITEYLKVFNQNWVNDIPLLNTILHMQVNHLDKFESNTENFFKSSQHLKKKSELSVCIQLLMNSNSLFKVGNCLLQIYDLCIRMKLNIFSKISFQIVEEIVETNLTNSKSIEVEDNLEESNPSHTTSQSTNQPEEDEKAECLKTDEELVSKSDSNSLICSTSVQESKSKPKLKKRRRSSLSILTEWAWSSDSNKRNRNKISNCTESEGQYFFEEVLKQILPDDLLITEKNSCSENSFDQTKEKVSAENFSSVQFVDQITSEDFDSLTNDLSNSKNYDEHSDVKKYLNNLSTCSLVHAILKFVKFIGSKWNQKLSYELLDVAVNLYTLLRNHIPVYSVFMNLKNDSLFIDPLTILFFCELYADNWLSFKLSRPTTCNMSWKSGISSEDFGVLLSNLHNVSIDSNYDEHFFNVRLLWLQGHVFLYTGYSEKSLRIFEYLFSVVQQQKKKDSDFSLTLHNCHNNQTISEETLLEVLTCINRKKKLLLVKKYYDQKQYLEAVQLLKDTFEFEHHSKSPVFQDLPLQRQEHLYLLLECLWHLQNFQDCCRWSEKIFNESWHKYMKLTTKSSCNINGEHQIQMWIKVILSSLEKLNNCILERSCFIVSYMEKMQRRRLMQNLIQLISYQLYQEELGSELKESTLPWILVHFILQSDEDKKNRKLIDHSNRKSSSYRNVDIDICLPASIQILFKAHELLGHYGKCCINDGKLLKFILRTIIPKYNSPLFSSLKSNLKQPVEQIFYCLYGHRHRSPNSRSKQKYLTDHVKNHQDFSWEACQLLFEFYKPENWPDFHSKRSDSISSDTAVLFQKMCEYLPSKSNPKDSEDQMKSYLEGSSDNLPQINEICLDRITYMYYLIADYYFKTSSNQNWIPAIKYYILDLCIHPNEPNSWAGLAMSISTLLEHWINNFQPCLNEDVYLKKAVMAERSFFHATDLSPSNLTIWAEFGTFLYSVHSFCSRLLKQESDSLDINKFETYESRKENMLKEAKRCFIKAQNIYSKSSDSDDFQDERWLYQYMLGKVAEKNKEEPKTYLEHYIMAHELLRINNAEYPQRISHKNPQNNAVEALEINYRIYASILKFIEENDTKPIKKSNGILFENAIRVCARLGNFEEYSFVNRTTIPKNKRKSQNQDQSSKSKKIKLAKTDSDEIHLLLNDVLDKVCNEGSLNLDSHQSSNCNNKTYTEFEIEETLNKCADGENNKINQVYSPDNSGDNSSSSILSNSSGSSDNTIELSKDQKMIEIEDDYLNKIEIDKIVDGCLKGLEMCALRFPEHYKSIYRLAFFYFNSKSKKNMQTSKKLLLNTYECQFHPNKTINGLFAERKSSNFFNGIWRNPVGDIDRPGSFPSHMSRCIILLMEVLKESNDNKILMDLFVQLQKNPEADKKYIKDGERQQLAFQALTLAQQCLRTKLKSLQIRSSPENLSYSLMKNLHEEKNQILLDIYQTEQILKNIQEYEKSEYQKVRKLLEEAYQLFISSNGTFENAREYCRTLLRNNKLMSHNNTMSKDIDFHKYYLESSTVPLPLSYNSQNYAFDEKASIYNQYSASDVKYMNRDYQQACPPNQNSISNYRSTFFAENFPHSLENVHSINNSQVDKLMINTEENLVAPHIYSAKNLNSIYSVNQGFDSFIDKNITAESLGSLNLKQDKKLVSADKNAFSRENTIVKEENNVSIELQQIRNTQNANSTFQPPDNIPNNSEIEDSKKETVEIITLDD
ncbi:calcineurin-binding protein cabin-1-like [Trichogramma pretiosum]|uniref:calcineurin-binding protein cabin-1-like n=1 Tax=Trichogramma pretiosum TaxID=7493 RepID=UPI0006C9757E|nr:calcineurin-binding protein cabin-1-like [Trichogramma pretiosum]